jgi:hypothetical protein
MLSKVDIKEYYHSIKEPNYASDAEGVSVVKNSNL